MHKSFTLKIDDSFVITLEFIIKLCSFSIKWEGGITKIQLWTKIL